MDPTDILQRYTLAAATNPALAAASGIQCIWLYQLSLRWTHF